MQARPAQKRVMRSDSHRQSQLPIVLQLKASLNYKREKNEVGGAINVTILTDNRRTMRVIIMFDEPSGFIGIYSVDQKEPIDGLVN